MSADESEKSESSALMSNVLKQMAQDHIKFQSESSPSPTSSKESIPSQVGDADKLPPDGDDYQPILLSLLQKREAMMKFQIVKDQDGTNGHGGKAMDTDGSSSEDMTKVIDNVDRSRSFLMQLLTESKQKNLLAAKSDKKEIQSNSGEASVKEKALESVFSMDDGNVIVIEPHSETINVKATSSAAYADSSSGDHRLECTICDEAFLTVEELTGHLLSSHVMDSVDCIKTTSHEDNDVLPIQPEPSSSSRRKDRSSDAFSPQILSVSGNMPFYSENSNELPAKEGKGKSSMIENDIVDDPSIGFVQGYLCKECGFLRKSLQDLKQHIQEEHSGESSKGTPSEKLAAGYDNLLIDKRSEPEEPEPQPEPPTCLVCTREKGHAGEKKFSLKNIFALPGRFDKKLNNILRTEYTTSNVHSENICNFCLRKVKKIEMAKKLEVELREDLENTLKVRTEKKQEKKKRANIRKKKNAQTRKVVEQRDYRKQSSHESKDESDNESGTPAPIMVCLPGSSVPQLLRPKLVSTPGSQQGTYVYIASQEDKDIPPLPDDHAEEWRMLEQKAREKEEKVARKKTVRSPPAMGVSKVVKESSLLEQSNSSALRSLLDSPIKQALQGKSKKRKHDYSPSIGPDVSGANSSFSHWSQVPIKKEKIEEEQTAVQTFPDKLRERSQFKISDVEEYSSKRGTPARAAKQRCRQSFATLQEDTSNSDDSDSNIIHKSPLKKRLYKPAVKETDKSPAGSEHLRNLLGTFYDPEETRSSLRNLLDSRKNNVGGKRTSMSPLNGSERTDARRNRELGQLLVKQEPRENPDNYNHLMTPNQAGGMDLRKPGGIDPAIKKRYMIIPSKGGGSNWLTAFRCTICFSVFYTEDAIELHVKCHLDDSSELECFMCGFSSEKLPTQWRIIRRHLELSHGIDPVVFSRCPCPVPGCMLLFRYQSERDQHLIKVHNQLGPAHASSHYLKPNGLFDYSCPLCGTSLQSLEALDIHVKCHNGNPKSYRCYLCEYSHPSQPGSWRFMRGHLSRDHMPGDIPNDWFTYFECPRYTCRIKFSSANARDVHDACHDHNKDGHFKCNLCGYRVNDTPFMWEPVRDHVIKYHPHLFAGTNKNFECSCGMVMETFSEFQEHITEENAAKLEMSHM